MPALVLWGTADRMVPPESAETYRNQIPHATVTSIDGAVHELPEAAETRWLELVSDLIDRHC